MKCPPVLQSEPQRLAALAEYEFIDSLPLPSLEPIPVLATRLFGTTMAAINMVGSEQVFFAASAGIGDADMRRDVSFCAHAMTQDDVMVVPDARHDERFHDNPLVTGDLGIRFYAGVPLLSPGGLPLGALCIIDHQPQDGLSDKDKLALRELGRIASDKLELRRLEVAGHQGVPRFETLAEHSPAAIVSFDADFRVHAWNAAASAMFGYEAEELVGQSIERLIPRLQRAAFRRRVAELLVAKRPVQLSMPIAVTGMRKNGTEFPAELAASCWGDGGQFRVGAIIQDVSERLQQQEKLNRLANFDTLTGIANRSHYYRAIEHNLAAGLPCAALVFDLDGFKDVNNTLGHAIGDRILREVGARLRSVVGPQDMVARIGGDEFAIHLFGAGDALHAQQLGEKAIAAIHRPLTIDGHDIGVGVSCGVALAPLHANEVIELIGNADLALFHVKGANRGHAFVFVPALREEASTRSFYDSELHRAVEHKELSLFYQPQFRLDDGQLVGAEALIRWRHPQRGLLSPAAFLPVLEGGVLAATVGDWILETACAQTAQWRRRGIGGFRMGINLFSAQFRVGDLAGKVIDALARHGLPPQAIELELTENIALGNEEFVLPSLRKLRDIGVGIAFDDFGTGYASLNSLKLYPLTRIKIDRSFVQQVVESRQDAAVVRAILDMAHNFDLEVIAEGIETEAQCECLRKYGCEEAQGFLFGRPEPPEVFAQRFLTPVTPSGRVAAMKQAPRRPTGTVGH